VPMPRKTKVVPIDQPEPPSPVRPRIIVRDAQTQRVIIGIGSQRIDFDVTTRVTLLESGDRSTIVPFSSGKGELRKPLTRPQSVPNNRAAFSLGEFLP